jgi:putative ABC transport system permease protein
MLHDGHLMELKSAWRGVVRNPGFSAVVIVTLALGIGATTALFSLVRAVFLKPLPLPAQERLVTVWEQDARAAGSQRRLAPASFVDWTAESQSFEAVGVLPNWTGDAWPFNVGGRAGLERVRGIYASAGFFEVMGVKPLMGSLFSRDEDVTAGRRRVILSYRFWRERFAGDPQVVGKGLPVDTFRGGVFTIVGVMPPEFDFPKGASIWLSLADWGGGPMPARDALERCCPWYTVFGRLKPDVTRSAASTELTTIAQRVALRHPDAGPAPSVTVTPLRETLVGAHRTTLVGLFGAVGCVFLIACANVANLLLARAITRRREVSTRLALGATRLQITRQFLTESLLVTSLGTALGLLIAAWTKAALIPMLQDRVPLIDTATVDWSVLTFAMVLTLATGAACGLAPLVEWRAANWRTDRHTEAQTTRRLRQALVVGEVALAVALVASAGLLVKTVVNLESVDVGFEKSRALIVSTDLTTSSLRARGRAARFVETLLPRLAGLPAVRAVAAATGAPFEGTVAGQAITREGDPVRPAAQSPQVAHTAVTTGFFDAMGMRILRGRGVSDSDRADGTLVAVINETAARRYWPGEDPVGKRFALGSRERFGSFRQLPYPGAIEWREIVGVVSDIRSAGFAAEIQPEVYYGYKQFPLYDPRIVVRAASDRAIETLATAVRQEIRAVNADAVIVGVRTLDDLATSSIAEPRLRAGLVTTFSAIAVLLGMLGIYGLMSYTVAQRTREIGIRMALGARGADVGRMVVGQALRLTSIGIMLGLLVALGVARWISSVFFGVSTADVPTLAITSVLLVSAAAIASAWPARRAVRIEPSVALRHD